MPDNKTAAMRAQTAQVEQTAVQNEAEYRIGQELAVANKQIEATQNRETKKIEADLAVKRRTTEADRELQIVAQESAIIVAAKSKEQSEAQTIAGWAFPRSRPRPRTSVGRRATSRDRP